MIALLKSKLAWAAVVVIAGLAIWGILERTGRLRCQDRLGVCVERLETANKNTETCNARKKKCEEVNRALSDLVGRPDSDAIDVLNQLYQKTAVSDVSDVPGGPVPTEPEMGSPGWVCVYATKRVAQSSGVVVPGTGLMRFNATTQYVIQRRCSRIKKPAPEVKKNAGQLL